MSLNEASKNDFFRLARHLRVVTISTLQYSVLSHALIAREMSRLLHQCKQTVQFCAVARLLKWRDKCVTICTKTQPSRGVSRKYKRRDDARIR